MGVLECVRCAGQWSTDDHAEPQFIVCEMCRTPQKTAICVTVKITVNAYSVAHAHAIVEGKLPNPEADGHASVDSWYIVGSDGDPENP